jgi:hypothetical protein
MANVPVRVGPVLVLAVLAEVLASRPAAQEIHHPFLERLNPAPRRPRPRLTAEATASAPFRALDNIEGDQVDLDFLVVRPMARSADGQHLFVVNPHGSRVVRFSDLSGPPSMVYDVPWGPVSIAHWVAPGDGHAELLVASRGTHALTRLDPDTGALLGALELPPEPADLLVLGDQAFVSTSAFDQVVQVDLRTNAIVDRFQVETARHVLFLSADGQGNVLVTPMLSGNGTMPKRSTVAGGLQSDPAGTVLDMTDPEVADVGLPDQDVFRLIPGATPFQGSVEVVATGVGTNLFAHAFDALNGKLWVLNTEARNADPSMTNEPALKGKFMENRLTLVDLGPPGTPPETRADHTFVPLDSFSSPVANPYALDLAFGSFGIVTGLLGDTVSILTPDGGEVVTWKLPEGSIPRGVLFEEDLSLVLVYCWGTNKVEVHSLSLPAMPLVARLDVGYDPTTAQRKRGREIFFDGDNSAEHNLSCYSCHVEVGTDFLAWNLSGMPVDDKGVMFTQNLKGIAPTRPYHWRGERELIDFNPAFAGLLGGTPLDASPGGDFEAFQAYLFGVQNPANPFEHPDRVVTNDRAVTHFDEFPFTVTNPALDAVRGQDLYFDVPTVGPASCQDCHTLPTGTDNDFFPDGAPDTAHRNTFVVPAYNGLWRKEQRTRVTVQEKDQPPELRPPLGAGTSHVGLMNGVFEFVTEIPFGVELEERENIAFFLHQVDQGLAPAVHRSARVAAGTGSEPFVRDYLMAQARARNCDVAVFGRVDLGHGPVRVRWAWDRVEDAFVAGDPAIDDRPLQFFFDQAADGTGDNLFLGLPVAMAERWAIDQDADGLRDGGELALGTDPHDPDSDGDGFLDGTEVAHGSLPTSPVSQPASQFPPSIRSARRVYVTARVAKFIVETSVPTTLVVAYASNLGDSGSVASTGLARHHSVLLRELLPSNELAGIARVYGGTIRATDEFGRSAQVALPTTQTEPFVSAAQDLIPFEVVARDLRLAHARPQFVRQGKAAKLEGFALQYEVRVEDRRFDAPAPLANHVAIARVIRNGKVVPASEIVMNGGPPAALIGTELSANFLYGGFGGFGPFVVGTISGPDGVSTIAFELKNAGLEDEVTLSLEVIGQPFDPGQFQPTLPIFKNDSLFDLPNTPEEFRALTTKL